MLDGKFSGVAGVNANAFAMGAPQSAGQHATATDTTVGTGSATSASKVKTKKAATHTFVVQRHNPAGASTTPAPAMAIEAPAASTSVPVNTNPNWLSDLGFRMQTGYGDAGTYTGYINEYMGGSNTSYGDTFSSSSLLGVSSGEAGSSALSARGSSPHTQPINIDINSIPAGSTSYNGTGTISGLAAVGSNSNLKPYDVNALIHSGSGVATGNPNLQPLDTKELLGSPEQLDEAGKKNPLLKQVQASLAPMGMLNTSGSGKGDTAREKAYNSIPAHMRNWKYFSGPGGVLDSLKDYDKNKAQRDEEKASKMSDGGKKSGGLLGGLFG